MNSWISQPVRGGNTEACHGSSHGVSPVIRSYLLFVYWGRIWRGHSSGRIRPSAVKIFRGLEKRKKFFRSLFSMTAISFSQSVFIASVHERIMICRLLTLSSLFQSVVTYANFVLFTWNKWLLETFPSTFTDPCDIDDPAKCKPRMKTH